MLNIQELVQKLSELAVGNISVRDFEDWFVPASWNANSWASAELRDAVYGLELELAEYSNGHRDRSHLRGRSADIARELGQFTQRVVPARIGPNLSNADIIVSGVAATSPRLAA